MKLQPRDGSYLKNKPLKCSCALHTGIPIAKAATVGSFLSMQMFPTCCLEHLAHSEKRFKCYEAKAKDSDKLGIETRTPGLSCQCSATKL